MKNTQIRAYHKPTNTWRFACLGQDGTYCRVDPHAGEKLEEFDCYEALDVCGDVFKVGKKIMLPKTYS